MSHLEQKFDPLWFLPTGSNIRDYFDHGFKLFPERGAPGHFYLSNLTFPEDITSIDYIASEIESYEGSAHLESWYLDFKDYVTSKGYALQDPDMTEDDLLYDLGAFLFSPSGFKYQNNFISIFHTPKYYIH